MTLILSRQKEDIAGSCLRNCVPPFHGKSGVLYKRSLLIAASVSELATRRRNPESKVRGSGLECQAATAQEQPRGATLCPRSGAAAERSYPVSEVSGGREETPRVRGQGR